MSWHPAKILAFCSCSLLVNFPAVADDQVAFTSLLPDSVVAYLEVRQPDQMISQILDHPLRPKIEELPPWQSWTKSKESRQLQVATSLVEYRLNSSWRTAVESLAQHGLVLAFDSATKGTVLAGRASEAAFLERARDTLLDLAAADAAQHGHPNPVEQREYRGIQVFRAGDARIATFDNWWLVTNNKLLGKRIVDAYLDGQDKSLSGQKSFREAAKNRNLASLAWAFVDVEALRNGGVAPALLQGKAKDFGAELLFGGILEALEQAPCVTLNLTGDFEKMQLTVACPFSGQAVRESRQFYFENAGPRGTFRVPVVPAEIASIYIHRDLGLLWTHAVDLIDDENVLARLDKAESDLSTLIGGRHFGDNVLNALCPDFQVVIADAGVSQDHDQDGSVRLPGVAVIGKLAKPAESRRTFQVAFQSLISFANFESSNSGYPPFELDVLREGGAKIVTAAYLDQASSSEDSPVHFADNVRDNISPTLAFANDYVVFSSTQTLARELVPLLNRQSESSESGNSFSLTETTNTYLKVNGVTLTAILNRNKNALIQRNMLEKGHSESNAKVEIETLLKLASLLANADLRLDADGEELRLSLSLNWSIHAVRNPRTDAYQLRSQWSNPTMQLSAVTVDSAWQRFDSSPAGRWDLDSAAHLFRRAAFSATQAELEASVRRGLESTVEGLLAAPGKDNDPFEEMSAQLARSAIASREDSQLTAWWLYRMLHSTAPAWEKATLFWHGHFGDQPGQGKFARVDVSAKPDAATPCHRQLSRTGARHCPRPGNDGLSRCQDQSEDTPEREFRPRAS